MYKDSDLKQLIEQKAQGNVDWLVSQGIVKDCPEARERALILARTIKRISELGKRERRITFNDPTNNNPFVGCNEICSIGQMGDVVGPLDNCIVVKHSTGPLYFCNSPLANRLPDGTLPLCWNYHQTEGNINGIKAVRRGKYKRRPPLK